MSYKLYNSTWNIKTWINKEHTKYEGDSVRKLGLIARSLVFISVFHFYKYTYMILYNVIKRR